MSTPESPLDRKHGIRRRRRSQINITKSELRPSFKEFFNRERREDIAFYGLLGVLTVMPFFYGGNRDWIWGSFLALTCAVSALTIWSVPVVERLASVGIHWRRPWFVVLLLLWLLLQLVHCVSWNTASFSSDRAASIRALLKTSLYQIGRAHV